jgi:anti-sigma regulatory factor (Ser/Thr protein kinase)
MAVEAQNISVQAGEHVVKLYEEEAELLDTVVAYLSAAAHSDEVAIVIATEQHRQAFQSKLEAMGIDLARARADDRFIVLDAASTMATFVSEGQIDHHAFHQTIGGLVRKAAELGRGVRAYGEMVALLWDAGDVLAAIELETLWNDLARELSFSLLCSYPMSSVSGSEHAEALHRVCELHSSVVDSREDSSPENPEPAFKIDISAAYGAERDAPGHARRMMVAELRRCGYRNTVVQDAALVLSEMATNAILHAGSPFLVSVRHEDQMLRIAVRDGSPLVCVMPEQGLIARSGHGLGLIDAVTARWDVEATSDGKVVWADLPV